MKKKIAPVFSLVLLLCILLVPGCSFRQGGAQSSPKKLVDTYMEAFRGGDFETMLELSGGWEGSAEELEFTRSFVEMIELTSYSIDAVEKVSRTEALVEVTVTLALLGHEKRQSVRLEVFKEDGKWYLRESFLK